MIYPFDLLADIHRMCDELVSRRRSIVGVTVGEEYRIAMEYFQSRGIEVYDSLDSPVDVLIELAD
jgi:hypothetical protein